MTRVLVINANASVAATEQLQTRCAPYAATGTTLEHMTADAGPEGIDTALDLALASVEVARIVAREHARFDAFVIACGGDPGLDAARSITSKPVIGTAEAGMLCACPLGASFALLTTLRADAASLTELALRYGMRDRLAGISALDRSTAALIDDACGPAVRDGAAAACHALVEDDMAEVIVLVGSVMIGMERHLTRIVGVPVLAAVACAIKLAESLVELGAHTSRAYKYAPVTKTDRLIGYPDLQSAYGTRDRG